jgi:CRISPR-associated protein Csb2
MLVLHIELLTGQYAATAYNNRRLAEWPPHPARLFSALVATWALDEDIEQRRALEWLEQQPPPRVIADAEEQIARRSVMDVYVPVNDVSLVKWPSTETRDVTRNAVASAKDARVRASSDKQYAKEKERYRAAVAKAAAQVSNVDKASRALTIARSVDHPEQRPKQARTFPVVVPRTPHIAFVWPVAPAPPIQQHLTALVSRLTRLGHSSSLVLARLLEPKAADALAARVGDFSPDDDGEMVLRWIGPGQLARLESQHAKHQAVEPRVLPAVFQRYTRHRQATPAPLVTTAFDPRIIVLGHVDGPRLPITAAPALARQLRRALMAVAEEPIAPVISGHAADGAPLTTPHMAYVPLPNIATPHADGALLGIALCLPRGASPDARVSVLRALAKLEEVEGNDRVVRVHMGDIGVLELRRELPGENHRLTTTPSRWTTPARRWVSATPVALDRNPGDLHDRDLDKRNKAFDAADVIVREAVRHAAPDAAQELVRVEIHRSALLPGHEKPVRHPRYPESASRPARVLVHIILEFAREVQGPLLLGAGRHAGLGLMLPLRQADVSADRTQ